MSILNNRYDFISDGRKFMLLLGTRQNTLYVDGEVVCELGKDVTRFPSKTMPYMVGQLEDSGKKKAVEVYATGWIRSQISVIVDGKTVFSTKS